MKNDIVLLLPTLFLVGLVVCDIVAACFAIWFLFQGQFLSAVAAAFIALLIERVKASAAEAIDESGLYD